MFVAPLRSRFSSDLAPSLWRGFYFLRASPGCLGGGLTGVAAGLAFRPNLNC